MMMLGIPRKSMYIYKNKGLTVDYQHLRDTQKDGGQGKREMGQPEKEKNQEEMRRVPG